MGTSVPFGDKMLINDTVVTPDGFTYDSSVAAILVQNKGGTEVHVTSDAKPSTYIIKPGEKEIIPGASLIFKTIGSSSVIVADKAPSGSGGGGGGKEKPYFIDTILPSETATQLFIDTGANGEDVKFDIKVKAGSCPTEAPGFIKEVADVYGLVSVGAVTPHILFDTTTGALLNNQVILIATLTYASGVVKTIEHTFISELPTAGSFTYTGLPFGQMVSLLNIPNYQQDHQYYGDIYPPGWRVRYDNLIGDAYYKRVWMHHPQIISHGVTSKFLDGQYVNVASTDDYFRVAPNSYVVIDGVMTPTTKISLTDVTIPSMPSGNDTVIAGSFIPFEPSWTFAPFEAAIKEATFEVVDTTTGEAITNLVGSQGFIVETTPGSNPLPIDGRANYKVTLTDWNGNTFSDFAGFNFEELTCSTASTSELVVGVWTPLPEVTTNAPAGNDTGFQWFEDSTEGILEIGINEHEGQYRAIAAGSTRIGCRVVYGDASATDSSYQSAA